MMNHQCGCTTNALDDGSSRNLVVAFDGTENQYGPESSHVIEFYARVIKNKRQLSYYNSGIGTYTKPSLAGRVKTVVRNKWAALTAWNFKSNLLAGYRWLAENYQDGDRIYLLGFSRGAYQARVLAAMIHEVGLICTGNEEQIPFAFDIYESGAQPINRNWKDPNAPTTLTGKFKEAFCREVNIHFVGVWDTVSSLGIFRHKSYPGADSAENICFFRHALALDERRVKFLPEYIDETWFQREDFYLPRCKEVWFRGSHSDIGGGNRKNPGLDIGGVPSRWMAYEAMLAGLQLKPFLNPWDLKDFVGEEPSNSMSLFYLLIEYIPFITWQDTSSKPFKTRRIPHKKRPRNIQPHQKIHISAGLHSYADEDKKTIANLPQPEGDTLSWGLLSAIFAERHSSQLGRRRRTNHPPSKSIVSGLVRKAIQEAAWTVHGSQSEDEEEGPSSTIGRSLLHAAQLLPGDDEDEDEGRWPWQSENEGPSSTIGKSLRRAAQLLSWLRSLNERAVPPQGHTEPMRNEWFKKFISKFELDWLDFDVSPTLIDGVNNGLNVVEFLERLNLISHSDEGIQLLRKLPACWELTLKLLKEGANDVQKADYGIRLASKLIDTDCHDGADYLQLFEAVQAIERSQKFDHERTLTLLGELTNHSVVKAWLGQEQVAKGELSIEERAVLQRLASDSG